MKITSVKRIIIDLDNTLTVPNDNLSYEELEPNIPIIEKLRECHKDKYEIVIFTSRNMRTYSGSIGKINVYTLPKILLWLEKHNIPFDEVIVGKPWCGDLGFYVDDRAIRPNEFIKLDLNNLSKEFDI